MLRRSLALLLATLAAGPAAADPPVFHGAWHGKGTYILRGDVMLCPSFDLYFTATADTFMFNGGQRTCDRHEEKFGPVRMEYRDGTLYFGPEVIGSYKDGFMEARYRQPDGNTFRNWRMSMRREGDTLVYEESRTMDGETTPIISFAGVLLSGNSEQAARPEK